MMLLTEGQMSDHKGAYLLLDALPNAKELLGDKGYDSDWLRAALTARGITPCIPPKSNRLFPADFDRETYKWWHLIENFFQKIKEYRGIATRFCKTDTNYKALISLIATVIRLK